MKKIIYISTAVMMLAACSKEPTQGNQNLERIPIAVNPVIASIDTRTSLSGDGSGYFEVNDEIGLYIKQNAAPSLVNVVTLYDNSTYRVDAIDAATHAVTNAAYGPYYWQDIAAQKALFVACYPKITFAADDSRTAYVFNMNGKTDNEQRDLLLAKAAIVYPANEVALAFDHAMTNVVIKVVSGKPSTDADPYYADALISGSTVTINARERAVVNFESATAAEDGSASNTVTSNLTTVVSDFAASVLTKEFVVAPQTLSQSDVLVKIVTVDNKTYQYIPKVNDFDSMAPEGDALVLAGGKRYVITLTLQKTTIEVSSVTINAWSAGAAVDKNPDAVIPD